MRSPRESRKWSGISTVWMRGSAWRLPPPINSFVPFGSLLTATSLAKFPKAVWIGEHNFPGSSYAGARCAAICEVQTFYKAWRSACERAKLGRVLFHDLRRTGVRNLVRAGVPERVAMMISGHKTRAVFERYNIVSSRDLKDAGNKLESYFATQKEKKPNPRQNPPRDNSGTIERSTRRNQKTPSL